MGKGDDLRQPADHLGDLRRAGRAAAAVPFVDHAGEIAAGNIFILQARRLGAEIGLPQRHNPRMFSLQHQAIEQLGLVAQCPGRRGIEAEFQGDRRRAREVWVGRPPYFAEAADPQKLHELPFTNLGAGPQNSETLQVQAPANENAAPPGVYMLFYVNSRGKPSIAEMVQLAVLIRVSEPGIVDTVQEIDSQAAEAPDTNCPGVEQAWAEFESDGAANQAREFNDA